MISWLYSLISAPFSTLSIDTLERLNSSFYVWTWITGTLAGLATVAAVTFGGLDGITSKIIEDKKAALREEAEKKRLVEEKELKEKVAASEKAAELLRMEMAATKTQLQSMEKSQAPRRLTQEKRGKFIEALRAGPMGVVHMFGPISGDPEAASFAKDLLEALQQAGWKIEGYAANVMLSWRPSGVALIVRSAGEGPPYAKTLQDALEAAGFNAPGYEDSNKPPGSLSVVVGHKE